LDCANFTLRVHEAEQAWLNFCALWLREPIAIDAPPCDAARARRFDNGRMLDGCHRDRLVPVTKSEHCQIVRLGAARTEHNIVHRDCQRDSYLRSGILDDCARATSELVRARWVAWTCAFDLEKARKHARINGAASVVVECVH
jgi:hypothetical protein